MDSKLMLPLLALLGLGGAFALSKMNQSTPAPTPGPAPNPSPAPAPAGNCAAQLATLNASVKAAVAARVASMAAPNDAAKKAQAVNANNYAASLANAYAASCGALPEYDQNGNPIVKQQAIAASNMSAQVAYLNSLGGARSYSPGITMNVPAGPYPADPIYPTQDPNRPWIEHYTMPATVAPRGTSVYSGPFGGPDLQWDSGLWPIESVGLPGVKDNPIFPGLDPSEVRRELDAWAGAISFIVFAPEAAPISVTTATKAAGDAEFWMAHNARGSFVRYVAFIYALFLAMKHRLTEGSDESARANHVIVLAEKTLKSLGADPARVPWLPFEWVPRDADGDLYLPPWGALGLYPGI